MLIIIYCAIKGMSLNRTNSTIVVEALATGCVATTVCTKIKNLIMKFIFIIDSQAMLTIHNACASTINLFGTDEQRTKYLPGLCSLDVKASFCLTEPGEHYNKSAFDILNQC